MTRLGDLFDPAALEAAITDGYVTRRPHPTDSLVILNYTDKTMWDKAWSPVTLQCRGLIARWDDTDEIVARPWPKAFNSGDPLAGALRFDAPVEVTDKIDGSLGISYLANDGWAIATRGSFASDQAVHATKLLRAKYPDWSPPPGVTALFEIVYPTNRIVVGYGDQDDLILLGYVATETGTTHGPYTAFAGYDGWSGPRTSVMPAYSLAEALALPPRANVEGVVVRYLDTGQQVKIKQADYVALHGVVTNCSARRLWEVLAVTACAELGYSVKQLVQRLHTGPQRVEPILAHGGGVDAVLIDGVPDEFRDWVEQVIRGMQEGVAELGAEIQSAFETALAKNPDDRKSFVLDVADHEHRAALLSLLDGRDITHLLWRMVEPPGDERPFARSEAVA